MSSLQWKLVRFWQCIPDWIFAQNGKSATSTEYWWSRSEWFLKEIHYRVLFEWKLNWMQNWVWEYSQKMNGYRFYWTILTKNLIRLMEFSFKMHPWAKLQFASLSKKFINRKRAIQQTSSVITFGARPSQPIKNPFSKQIQKKFHQCHKKRSNSNIHFFTQILTNIPFFIKTCNFYKKNSSLKLSREEKICIKWNKCI